MANKKVFTIEIDGLEKAYNNTIKLRDAIKSINDIKLGIDGNINIVTNNIEQNLGDLSQASISLEQSFTELTYTVNENRTAAENNAQADATKANSIKGLKKTLEDLKKEYNSLSEAERKSSQGTDLLIKIQKLTKQIEIASDKNYGYVKTLNTLTKATKSVNGVFGEVSTLLREGSSIAQTFGVNVDSVTTVMNGLETAISAVSTIQKIMNTVNTIATVVQQGFNQAVKANPLMALASALIAVVTAAYASIKATKEASEASDKNAESTDKMNKKMEETNELHKKAAESAGKSRQSYEELRKKWKELKTDQFLKDNKDKFRDLGVEVNNVKDAENLLINNTEAFIKAMNARAMATAANQKITHKDSELVDLEIKKEEALSKLSKSDLNNRKLTSEFFEGIKKNLLGEIETLNNITLKGNKEYADFLKTSELTEAKEDNNGTGKQNNSGSSGDCNNSKKKKCKEEELNDQKDVEEGYEKLNTARENLSNKNIEREEKERKANAKTVDELKAVQKEILNRTKESQEQEVKQTEETYDKLLETGSKEAEVLTEQKNQHIQELQKDHANTLNTIVADNQKEQVDLLTKGYEEKTKVITESNAKIAELEKDKKETKENGNIDVEGTRNNLIEIGKNLESQKTRREENEANIISYYDGLAQIYAGDTEKTEENEKLKQKALAENAKALKALQKKIGENTKEEADLIGERYKELATKITDISTKIKENVATIFSAMSDMLKGQVEEAKENLTNVTKQYDAVVEKKKESQDKLKSLEEEAKTASGGRAMVVQEQIARQMEANDELAAQEKDLAKQKEKAEKEKAKKEKQQKKVELAQKLISVVTDTATAISKSVVASPITFGLPWSAFAAATGAIQTATIIKQMSKLEDGGMLRGKRHSQGGMRIEGTNIEVEGNEYVVNRVSTSKNLGLIDYINRNRKELRAEDLNSYFARTGGSLQQIAIPTKQMYEQGGMLTNLEVVDSINSPDNDQILEAISQINFKPVVSVVDITSAQNNLSEVKDIAGA